MKPTLDDRVRHETTRVLLPRVMLEPKTLVVLESFSAPLKAVGVAHAMTAEDAEAVVLDSCYVGWKEDPDTVSYIIRVRNLSDRAIEVKFYFYDAEDLCALRERLKIELWVDGNNDLLRQQFKNVQEAIRKRDAETEWPGEGK